MNEIKALHPHHFSLLLLFVFSSTAWMESGTETLRRKPPTLSSAEQDVDGVEIDNVNDRVIYDMAGSSVTVPNHNLKRNARPGDEADADA